MEGLGWCKGSGGDLSLENEKKKQKPLLEWEVSVEGKAEVLRGWGIRAEELRVLETL